MTKLSIIIPSRNERFLSQTIDDIFNKATGDVQVIAVLDGYWPVPPLIESPDRELVMLHRGVARGMRSGINSGVGVADGKYIMKVDAHCMFAKGFDEVLKADCDDNWVVIPRRKRLDAENWCPIVDNRPDVDYEYLRYPFHKPDQIGIHGTLWNQRTRERTNIMIDDNMGFQGSCWFSTKEHFLKRIGGLQEEGYGTFIGEPQEIGNKTWLGGGRVIVNKNTWYAHLYKGKRYGRGYRIGKNELHVGNLYSADYWYNNRWEDRIYDFSWLVDKFSPCPTWPEDKSEWKVWTL